MRLLKVDKADRWIGVEKINSATICDDLRYNEIIVHLFFFNFNIVIRKESFNG